MRRFDCEKRLLASRIPIFEYRLPEGMRGLAFRHPQGGFMVALQQGLSQVERRCTITHEFYHIALYPDHVFSFHDTYFERIRESRIEHKVKMATAAHLISRTRLLREIRQADSLEQIAEALGVAVDVVEDAILLYRLKAQK